MREFKVIFHWADRKQTFTLWLDSYEEAEAEAESMQETNGALFYIIR